MYPCQDSAFFASGYEKKGYENVKFAYEAIDVKKLIYIPVAYKQI